jgi:chaperonin GroES
MAMEVANPEKVKRNKGVKKLLDFIGELNIADKFNDVDGQRELDEIGHLVCDEFKIDKESRKDWETQMEIADKLVRLLAERKTFPWDGASNAIYPLMAQAAIQFNSRSLPLMTKAQRATKCRVNGPDPQGIKAKIADLVGEHMSWQLLDEMDDWLGEQDSMLLALPIMGCAFKKVYRDIPNQRNASEYYSPMDIVINYKARNMQSAKRITHVFELSKREIVERQRAGIFLEIDLGHGDQKAETGDIKEQDPSFVLLEQHRWLDLDDDGLDEPYIVTVHQDSEKVLRIRPRYDERGIVLTADEKRIARIKPIQFFVRYLFMPSPDRNIYGYGFGQLLLHPSVLINSIINQTIDAGTWYNTNAGFVSRDLGAGRGLVTFQPNEKKVVDSVDDINKKIFMLPAREPSQTLFSVLGLLLEASERLGNSVDVLTGEHSTSNQPASTTLALIEQGLKFYKAAIGRLFKGLKDEFKLLFDLNARYMSATEEQFFRLFETEDRTISGAAYNTESLDVVPVSANEEVTVVEKLIKAEQLQQWSAQRGFPWQVQRNIDLRYLEALGQEDIDAILPPPDWQPPTDPKVELDRMKLELDAKKLKNEDMKMGMELQKLPLELMKLKLELLEKKEGIKDKALKAQVDAAAKIADSDTKRKKVEVQDKMADNQVKIAASKPKPKATGAKK